MANRIEGEAKVTKVEEPPTVAYDPRLLRNYLLGNITLADLEGIDKDTQYKLAEKGYLLLSEGQLDEAERVFKGLIALDPFDSYFHTVLAAIYQRQDKKEAAIEEYTRALKINPFNTTALANRGEILFQKGDLAEATEDLKQAIRLDPQGKDPATLRSRVLAMAVAKALKSSKAASAS